VTTFPRGPAGAASFAAIVAIAWSIAAHPAEAATRTCGGETATVRKAKVVKGTSGDDVLIGGGRDQKFLARGGNDRVCAGGGNDVVLGQGGDDVLHGEGRGDDLRGGSGDDRIYGDILDDFLRGGPGNDSLIGGHGVDKMFGGPGDDLLRGGTNRDCLYGQGGSNTASFATATPPGLPGSATDGVEVNLADPLKGACPRRGSGSAEGDGAGEVLDGISFVVGSAFADSIQGPGAAVDAGLGADACAGFGQMAGCGVEEKPAGTFAQVFEPATGAPPDPGLIVRAAPGIPSQAITVAGAGSGATVTSAGDPLVPGPRCDAAGTCTPATGTLGYVLVWGDDLSDTVTVGAGLPADATVDLDGGPGDDTLTGSDYIGEVLFGGDSAGADALSGGGGFDALVSEGGGPSSGPDTLAGGAADDQLVADYPCAGHTFSGGPGNDVAGFARGDAGISARIGGEVTFTSGGCRGGTPNRLRLDNEVLEGTPSGDRLIGSADADVIWGREGPDVIIGRGGADDLQGFAGRDLIDARDGRRDRLIRCGAGRDRAARVDRADPDPISC
jgi:Ca2+-binding RTX toxin-like protein